MTRIILVLGFALLFAAQADAAKKPKAEPKKEAPVAQEARACMPVAPLFDRLRTSGIEFEDITDPVAVARIAKVIAANTEAAFQVPTRLIVVFVGDEAKIGIIVGDKLCAVVTGPAHEVRLLLRAVHGQSVGEPI